MHEGGPALGRAIRHNDVPHVPLPRRHEHRGGVHVILREKPGLEGRELPGVEFVPADLLRVVAVEGRLHVPLKDRSLKNVPRSLDVL